MANPMLAAAQFDYSSLDPSCASQLQASAQAIRLMERNITADALRIGHELIIVKERLEHGAFQAWLSAEFAWSDRHARNYMAAAKQFYDKSEVISDLPLTTVCALAAPSTPEPVRANVIQKLEGGDAVDPDVIKFMIYTARREQAEARRIEKLTPEQRSKAEQKSRRAKAQQTAFASKFEQERAAAKELGERATDQIIELLGADLQEFVVMLEGADLHAFFRRLKEHLQPTVSATRRLSPELSAAR